MFYDVNAKFYDLYFKQVRVIDNEGIIYQGKVICVSRADENDSGEDSIGIETNPVAKFGYDLDRSEIVSIEILEEPLEPCRMVKVGDTYKKLRDSFDPSKRDIIE